MKTALVTGGNKGIGFEICRQLAEKGVKVILTARDEKKGEEAAKKLNVLFHQLDVSDESSRKSCFDHVKKEFGKLDILINNAGILLDMDESILSLDLEKIKKTVETNSIAPLRLAQLFAPIMKGGRIINMSSGAGQFSALADSMPVYRISKVALNAVTRVLAGAFHGDILVNSMSPGWCKTDMGGKGAPKTAAQGADTAVWLALECKETGKFWADRKVISW